MNDYNSYLRTRTRVGYLYRKFFLYPKLSSLLNGRILDIGCGIGDFLKFNSMAYGIDINKNNIKFCQNLGLDCSIYSYDDVNAYKNLFDSFLLDNVLEHLIDSDEMLDFITKISKKNSIFILGVPGKRGFKRDPDHKIFYDKKITVYH